MAIIQGKRVKSAREEALHGVIQQAMNWRPEHAHLCPDGKYWDAYGKEYVRMSWSEFLKRHEVKEEVVMESQPEDWVISEPLKTGMDIVAPSSLPPRRTWKKCGDCRFTELVPESIKITPIRMHCAHCESDDVYLFSTERTTPDESTS